MTPPPACCSARASFKIKKNKQNQIKSFLLEVGTSGAEIRVMQLPLFLYSLLRCLDCVASRQAGAHPDSRQCIEYKTKVKHPWPDTVVSSGHFHRQGGGSREAAAGSDREQGWEKGERGVSYGLLTNLEGTVALSYSTETERERESGICAHQIMSS